MPTLVSAFGLVAALSALSVLFLLFGSKLPGPLRDIEGGNSIGFAFLVYFIALVTLLVGAVAWSKVREVLSSRYKYLFSASALVVIAFVAFVSFALYSLSQSTDL